MVNLIIDFSNFGANEENYKQCGRVLRVSDWRHGY